MNLCLVTSAGELLTPALGTILEASPATPY